MADVHSVLSNLTTEKLGELENQKQAVKLLKQTASRLKHLRNDLTRVLKKTKRSNAPKDKSKMSNSGLMKPVVISKELAAFMKVPHDSLQSRVTVTNAICTYIKEHNLQNPANKREILADAELSKILGYKSDGKQPLTYFYIQQLIQPHFLKGVSNELATFMKVSADSLQSSTSVAASLKAYVTSKSLLHGDNVTLDDTLSKLLNKSGSFPLASLNQFVKSHFKK
jgi:chromatin remodeling complex protein RSC6